MCGPFLLGEQLTKSNKPAADVTAATPPAALPASALRDEHAGHGGSYTYDPAAGKRTPTEKPNEQSAEKEVNNG